MSWPPLESLILESQSPPSWLVQDLFYQQSLICLAGVPGVGKSVFAYSLAIAVASGTPFLGLQTSQGRVLYFDEENGPANMPTYFRWAWRGLDCPPLAILEPNLRLGQNSILQHPGSWLDYLLDHARTFRPNLIIFDTSASCFRIRDENDNAEASRVIGALRQVQQAADSHTTLLVLRHARVERDPQGFGPDTHRMRGATAWAGLSDGVMFHLAHPGRPPAGLRPTYLLPDKTRAYGLRHQLNISPTWTCEDESSRGIKLTRDNP